MASGNASFTKLITTTLQNLPSEVVDNLSTNNALYYMLSKKGNIKIVSGGRSFTHALLYKLNTSFKSYGKLDAIATPLNDDLTRAEFPIKIVAGSIVVSMLELAMNAGQKEKLIDLAEETTDAAKISMAEEMGNQTMGDGSVSTDMDGIQYLISDAPSAQTDVGGIDSSASGNDYWRNQTYTTSISTFNTSLGGMTQMDAMLNACTFGRQGPKLIVTTKAIFSLYQMGLTNNMRYAPADLPIGKAGFQALQYATLPIVFDDNCPAYHMYFIDTDNLKLQVLSQGNMEVTDMQQPVDQLIKIALMYIFGNLTTGSRRTSGVLTNITG